MEHVNVTPIIMDLTVTVSNNLSLFDDEMYSETFISLLEYCNKYSTCKGKGYCTSSGTCKCSSGYYGSNCSSKLSYSFTW